MLTSECYWDLDIVQSVCGRKFLLGVAYVDEFAMS